MDIESARVAATQRDAVRIVVQIHVVEIEIHISGQRLKIDTPSHVVEGAVMNRYVCAHSVRVYATGDRGIVSSVTRRSVLIKVIDTQVLDFNVMRAGEYDACGAADVVRQTRAVRRILNKAIALSTGISAR